MKRIQQHNEDQEFEGVNAIGTNLMDWSMNLDVALSFGRVVYIRGADIYAIGRKEVALYAREGIDLAEVEAHLDRRALKLTRRG